jgi:hypothetical protein
VQVLTRCDDCDDGVAVHARHANRHRAAFAALCASYSGPHCARARAVLRPACRERRCTLVTPE